MSVEQFIPSEEDFLKSAIKEVNECIELFESEDETRDFHDIIIENSLELFMPFWRIDQKFLSKDFPGAGFLQEQLEEEKVERWSEWMEAVEFFYKAGAMERVEGECKVLWKWIGETCIRYLQESVRLISES